ncbi:MAG: transcriptional regulator [Chloroflexi bacterium]|nr:transcriptional regulator [Chloroflexota bacterium]
MRRPLTEEAVVLDETIHQATRLRIMTLLVGQPETDRLAYGFIQKTLGLTGGNLTIHLRKLEDADYLVLTKEFVGAKPRTWIQATPAGRQAFAEYLANLERALNGQLHR